jgi:hypothetical protein
MVLTDLRVDELAAMRLETFDELAAMRLETLFGVARPHQIEDAEFHRPLLRFAWLPQPWPR